MANNNWNATDAASLDKYLADHPKVVRELEARMPEIKTETVEGSAMSGARHAGALDLLNALRGMRSQGPEAEGAGFIDPSKD